MSEGVDKPHWYRVVIPNAQWSPVHDMGRRIKPASMTLGKRCACCNAETAAQLEAGTIRVPRCQECRKHLRRTGGNDGPLFAAACGWLALIALAIRSSWLFAIPAVVVLAGVIAFLELQQRRRRELHAKGHFNGFKVWAAPAAVHVKTTNAQLAKDLATLDSRA